MKKLAIGLFIFVFALFVFVPNTYAKVIVQDKGAVTISSNEVVNDDLFIGAESVEILGTVNGDVYVGAGMVEVDGLINGDLLIGGGSVTLTGKVRDDVYIGGGNVTVQKASIGDSLLVGSGSLNIDEESTIGGSLLVGSGIVNNKASVGRNFFAGAGNVSLDSSVGGEVRIGAGEIKVGDNTKVAGDFYYSIGEDGKDDLVLPEGSTVSGSVKKIKPSVKTITGMEDAKTGFLKASGAFRRIFLAVSFLGALLVGVLAIKIFSKRVDVVINHVTKSLFSNLGIGFLILVLTVPLAFIVMLTGVGASLSMIVLALFGIAVYLAKLVSSLALGAWLSNRFGWKKMNIYTNFVLGLVLFFILKSIPVVSGLTSLLFTSVGLGAFFRLIKN
ncbi:hypothetical protein ACFL1Q_02400 [Patescibacteria group bacterium]